MAQVVALFVFIYHFLWPFNDMVQVDQSQSNDLQRLDLWQSNDVEQVVTLV